MAWSHRGIADSARAGFSCGSGTRRHAARFNYSEMPGVWRMCVGQFTDLACPSYLWILKSGLCIYYSIRDLLVFCLSTRLYECVRRAHTADSERQLSDMLTEEELHHMLYRRATAQRRPHNLCHTTAHHTPRKQRVITHKSLTLSHNYAGAGAVAHNSNISTM